jgi:hypothetical protein
MDRGRRKGHAIGLATLMLGTCAETRLAVMKDSPIEVVGIHKGTNSMDAGRGESKAIGRASSTQMRRGLTHVWRLQQATPIGSTGAVAAKTSI